MAMILFFDNTTRIVGPAKAAHIWKVLTGESEAENPAQASFVSQIANIYLNPNSKECPQSYKDRQRQRSKVVPGQQAWYVSA